MTFTKILTSPQNNNEKCEKVGFSNLLKGSMASLMKLTKIFCVNTFLGIRIK